MKILLRVGIMIVSIVAAFVLVTIAINAWCILGTRDNVHTVPQIEQGGQSVDAILVLGASVHPDGSPSDMLAHRLDVACDLYFAGASQSIVVSGDNRTSHYNESTAMKSYCIDKGVPDSAIYVDHAGYDTYASVYRCINNYHASSMIIVTQAYHLYRALMIAQMLGADAQGVASDKGQYNNQSHYSLREVLARDKDFFQALFHVVPEDADQTISGS